MKKLIYRNVWLLLAAVWTLTACEHKELCYEHPHIATIYVDFDWRDAPDASPAGMCVFFYPEDKEERARRYDFQGTTGGQIDIPVGHYRVLCYNNDTEAVLFDGTDDFYAHKAFTREGSIFESIYGNSATSAPRAAGTEEERVVISPDMMWGCTATEVEINEQGIAVAQIVANNYQGAKGAAEVFVEAMEEEGEYAELFGIDSDTNAQTRSTAFHEVIDQYPDMKLVAVQTANWDQNLAYQKMETILQSYPNLKGVISGNDNMAVGAAAAAKAAGKKLFIIGVDGSNDARDQILSGDMTATAMQPAALIAETAVRQADKYLKTGSTGMPEKN